MKKSIYTESAPEPIGPYSQGILSGNTLYISGQIALNPETQKMISGDIKVETRMILENIGAILKAADMDFSNVVKCSIFMADLAKFGQVNEAYAEYFGKSQPARETMEVKRLPKNANIEISAIARK